MSDTPRERGMGVQSLTIWLYLKAVKVLVKIIKIKKINKDKKLNNKNNKTIKAVKSGIILSIIASLTISVIPAQAAKTSRSVEVLKLYTHSQLMDSVQFHCIDILWTHESHWSSTAKNKKSTAYGIPQILGMKEKDAVRQIDLGIKYIRSRYGSACKALSHWRAHDFY